MNDFLKNLRNAQRKSPPRTSGPTRPDNAGHVRRETGDRYSPGNERRAMNDRRTSFPPHRPYRDGQEKDQYLPVIQATLANMASNMEKMVENQASLAHAQIKHHESATVLNEKLSEILTEKIVPILNSLNLDTENLNLGNLDPGNGERPSIKNSTSYARGTHYTKDEIIELIQAMRGKRSTYEEIAKELTEKGIPTFSGRGKWHAQTIHRLCKLS